ncbi:MAG TPA: hypothetical protein ENK18_27960, partial [Deltaproteobacteria bacterium]|nr:hypothetical protein [Deltaproteobacteria bacterium]
MSSLIHRSIFWLVLFASCDTPGCGETPEAAERKNVEAVVFASDSIITYRDGERRIGAIFEEEHRIPIHWDDLPATWVIAIVAAEDGRFWSHAGVDPKGVARAAGENVKAGTVVSGGSTLTQQIAKNLFDRPDRSLGSKMEELDYALHLERVFNKGELLALYANLFHVTGNGTGLGVAARYFFDKEPRDLTLIESAYLAGLVKGPANYDPFPGDAERRARARERAIERTQYVLERIVAEPISNLIPEPGGGKKISAREVDKIRKEAQALLDGGRIEVPFSRGRFRYESSILVDEVRRRLNTKYFKEILAAAGVTDPVKAGLTIVTTLDEAVQRQSTYGLWHHLSDLGPWLEGLGNDAFVLDAGPPSEDPSRPPRLHEFRNAVITEHVENHLMADLGGFACVIDRDAIVRAALAVHRGKEKNRYVKVPTASVDGFVEGMADGSVVWVSIRDVPSDGPALCDLEVRPELQGAVVVLEKGELRAMVGGNTNRDFNRIQALRQFGSTFKPLIYHAAISLGWQPDDLIDNRRHTFKFSGTSYTPRPDHEPSPWVSMAWAGVNSENLASIWLLYHLIDQMNSDQIFKLSKLVGLAQEDGESDDDYKTRIQKAGVLPKRSQLPESHFAAARWEVSETLVAQGQRAEARTLRSLSSGTNDSGRENWKHLQGRLEPCRAAYEALEEALKKGGSVDVRDLSMKKDGDELQIACGTRPEGFVSPSEALGMTPAGGSRLGAGAPEPGTPGRSISRAGRTPEEIAAQMPKPTPTGRGSSRPKSKSKTKSKPKPSPEPKAPKVTLPPVDELIIDDQLKLSTLEALGEAMIRQELAFEAGDYDMYSPEVLEGQTDFRVLLAMRYVTYLAARYGVQTELAEVLSLPLGATEITLEEATAMYAGLVSGKAVVSRAPDEVGPSVLISEIRDQLGAVIYKAKPRRSLVTGPEVGQMTADILRNVVLHGTGRAAKGLLTHEGAHVPIGG